MTQRSPLSTSTFPLEKKASPVVPPFNGEPLQAVATSSKKPPISHIPEAEGEAMVAVHFTQGLPAIVLGYLDNDIAPIEQEAKKVQRAKTYADFKLFGRGLKDLMSDEAAVVANLILRGEEADIQQALVLIKTKPILLQCPTDATDPLGRRVQGTPLQIAVMAGV